MARSRMRWSDHGEPLYWEGEVKTKTRAAFSWGVIAGVGWAVLLAIFVEVVF